MKIRVVDESNTPVQGAMVAVEWSDVPFPEIALITDPAGEVHIALKKGRYRFRAHSRDERIGTVDIAIGGDRENGADEVILRVLKRERR